MLPKNRFKIMFVVFINTPIKNILPFPLKRRSGSGYGDEDHGNEEHRARAKIASTYTKCRFRIYPSLST